MSPAEWFIAASLYTLAFAIAVLAVLAWPRRDDPEPQNWSPLDA